VSTETAPAGASFYALGPEFEWLAAAWDGFAHELTDVSSTLRHVVEAATADPQLAAESSGLAALESATDRLVRELVEDAARIRHTQTTYEQADAAVHAAVPTVHSPAQVPSGHDSADAGIPVFGAGIATGHQAVAGLAGAGSYPRSPELAGGGADYAAATAATADITAAAAAPDGSGLWHPAGAQDLSETALGTLSRVRRQMIARAEHWVGQRIPYNQGAWHEGYRTDCSGFVSMCWGLRDSLVTSTMPQIAHRIAKEDLRPGDVLLNTDVATGHVILFDRWADYAHNSYVGYELCPQGTLHHVIPYPYYGGFGVYEPYRYNNAGD
jgi:cell wall-associated NlpC family hydrolase